MLGWHEARQGLEPAILSIRAATVAVSKGLLDLPSTVEVASQIRNESLSQATDEITIAAKTMIETLVSL